jgi:hypothetical protein
MIFLSEVMYDEKMDDDGYLRDYADGLRRTNL